VQNTIKFLKNLTEGKKPHEKKRKNNTSLSKKEQDYTNPVHKIKPTHTE